MSPLTDPLGPDLKATLRSLKLGKLTATLPERLTLARESNMPHADFLQLVLADEVTRREAGSITLRARNAGRLDPSRRHRNLGPQRRHPLRPAAMERTGLPAVPRRHPTAP